MDENIHNIFASSPIRVSAPCRIDMGGTLDLPTFFYPLAYVHPLTVNMALALRTHVTLRPFTSGWIKVSSKGFQSRAYPIDEAPFDTELGLMFAVATYFRAEGVHVEISSESPPKSALGGSSVASVALIAALLIASGQWDGREQPPLDRIARLAYGIEASVAGVPCGYQDQLAAVHGGVHAWFWSGPGDGVEDTCFKGEALVSPEDYAELEQHLLIAYCGIPHESSQINSQWIRQFTAGRFRSQWVEIVECTRFFYAALKQRDFPAAAHAVNREVALRRKMTPSVLDTMGRRLVETAIQNGCGARFTGAGGGGCLWAIGEAPAIRRLKPEWQAILATRQDGGLLPCKLDAVGVAID